MANFARWLPTKHRSRIGNRLLLLQIRTDSVRSLSITNLQVSVISSGGLGTPKSIAVDVHQRMERGKRIKKYLFNCGEGTKRIYGMNMHKKNAIEDIFITLTNWENLGGLKGLFTERPMHGFSTRGEPFRKELKLYGPELMLDRFYVGKAPVYSLVNATMEMFHEDDYVQMKFVPFFPELSDEDLEQYPVSVRDEAKS
ncbi:uncharacterized protein [Argopecten irradians]|uniref:uncharacterized protein n=1 Tax=Argopecten irradians TaxID=31199 RepID=UPI00371BCA58